MKGFGYLCEDIFAVTPKDTAVRQLRGLRLYFDGGHCIDPRTCARSSSVCPASPGIRGSYNTVRLHSAIGYVTPQDRLAGRQAEIHAARDRKLEEARRLRQLRRQQTTSLMCASSSTPATMTSPGETEAGSAGRQPC